MLGEYLPVLIFLVVAAGTVPAVEPPAVEAPRAEPAKPAEPDKGG